MKRKDGLHVQFSQETPPISELKHFYDDVGWQSSDVFIHEAILFKPHSLLTTIWIRLSQKNKIIGMARLYLPPKSPVNAPAFICDFIIKMKYQGHGHGRFLIDAIEAHCKCEGIQQLVIQSNAKSDSFWKRIGFSQNEQLNGSFLFKSLS